MVNPRRPSSDNTMLPDEIDDDNVIAQNLSTSIRCQEYEAFSASKNYFGDVNVRLFILYFFSATKMLEALHRNNFSESQSKQF